MFLMEGKEVTIELSCRHPKPAYFAAVGIPIWDMTGTTPVARKCWKTVI